jgi:hypothetical protein
MVYWRLLGSSIIELLGCVAIATGLMIAYRSEDDAITGLNIVLSGALVAVLGSILHYYCYSKSQPEDTLLIENKPYLKVWDNRSMILCLRLGGFIFFSIGIIILRITITDLTTYIFIVLSNFAFILNGYAAFEYGLRSQVPRPVIVWRIVYLLALVSSLAIVGGSIATIIKREVGTHIWYSGIYLLSLSMLLEIPISQIALRL